MTKNYKAGGPLEVFFDLSAKQGILRPVTPGYVVEAKVFEKALADIANGADVVDTARRGGRRDQRRHREEPGLRPLSERLTAGRRPRTRRPVQRPAAPADLATGRMAMAAKSSSDVEPRRLAHGRGPAFGADGALHHPALRPRLLPLSFTNQRLVSPNPTEFVGTANFQQLLGLGRSDAGARARRRRARSCATTTATPTYPRRARLHPQQPGLSATSRACGSGSASQSGREPHLCAGPRRRLHEGARQHLPLRARRGAGAGRARAPPGADDQPAAARHQRLPHHLLHAGGGLDRRRVAALALHLRRQQRASEQPARRAHLRGLPAGRLARQPSDRARRHHGHVDLAGRRLPHGDLARRACRPSARRSTRRRRSKAPAAGRHSATSPGRAFATRPC